MEAGFRFCGIRILDDEFSFGVQHFSVGVGIGNFMLAVFANEANRGTDFFKVYLPIPVAVVFVPFDISPFEGLKLSALGTFKLPFALVGSFELPVSVVVFLAALGEKNAFAKPTKCRNTSFSLLHMPIGPLPSFVAYKPTDGTALKIALCVCAKNPERHAVREEHGLRFLFMSIGGEKLFYFWTFLKQFVETRFGFVFCVGVGLRKPQARPRKVRDYIAQAQFRAERLAGLDGRYYRHRPYVRVCHRLHHVPHPW